MQKINLAEEKICVDKGELLKAVNSAKAFGITTEGEVVYAPFTKEKLYIFQGKYTPVQGMLQAPKLPTLADFFGKTYKIEENEKEVCIDASDAWNEIVPLNRESALYDDTTSDGIMDFADEELEDISWHAVEFGITNRDIGNIIEEACEGKLFCVHKENPFFFSALVYVDDIECAGEKVREKIKEVITDKLKNDPDYHPDLLDDEQEEAVEFFGIEV